MKPTAVHVFGFILPETRHLRDTYLQGDAVTQLRADHYNHFGHCTRLSRMILTPTAVVNKPIG